MPRTRRSKKRLLWIAAPVVVLPALAFGLTAGVEARSVPDFTIPITYTTDTGRTISCSIDYFNDETNYAETDFGAVDYLRTQDWTGIGQRIYDNALARVTAGDPFLSDPVSGSPDKTIQEGIAWTSAQLDLIDRTIPISAMTTGYGGEDHCSRELH